MFISTRCSELTTVRLILRGNINKLSMFSSVAPGRRSERDLNDETLLSCRSKDLGFDYVESAPDLYQDAVPGEP